MEYVNLDTLVWFQEGPGVRNYQYVDKGIKLINVTNLVNGQLKLHLTSRYISEEEAFGKYKHFLCDNGDLVFASSGITYETLSKKIAFVTEKDLPLCMNTSVIRFKPINHDVCIDYIYYFFKSEKYRNQISKLMTGSAQLNYGPSHLHKVKIPYYDIVKQTKIADELKKIDENISICYRNIDNLDNIVKSQFIEMFGDPKVNPNGYEIKKISDIFNVGSSKRVFESEWTDSGVPFYRAREIVKLSKDGYVDNELYITEEMYDNYKKKYGVPQEDDMMVTGVGTLGICYIVKKEDKFYFKDGNTLWFKNKGLCNVRFIRDQYNTDFVREQIEANANASTVGTYTITNANNTRVLVPPIDLQNEYVSFCEVIDKSKYFGGVNYGIC